MMPDASKLKEKLNRWRYVTGLSYNYISRLQKMHKKMRWKLYYTCGEMTKFKLMADEQQNARRQTDYTNNINTYVQDYTKKKVE